MKRLALLLIAIIIVFSGCEDEEPDSLAVTALVDGSEWNAKNILAYTGKVNEQKILQTLIATAEDGSQIIISFQNLGLSPSKLSAEFRKKTATLSHFGAQIVEDRHVLLTWTTTRETGTSHFYVGRSVNGSDFTSLTYVYAHGYSEVENNYSYTIYDETQAAYSAATYRLDIVDYDGTVTFSDEIELKLKPAVQYRSPGGQVFGGSDGEVVLNKYDLKEGIVSGVFHFAYTLPNGTKKSIKNGVINSVPF